MYKTRLGNILENAVRLCGRDVTLNDIPADWKILGAMSLNEGLRKIAGEKFWMMTRIESRTYRPPYTSDTGWSQGQQCWYDGDYWQLATETSSGAPGTASCWTKLDMSELPAFIGWEQPWENTVIDRGGVDVSRFAYVQDPKYYPNASPLRIVGMSDFGVEIAAPAPKQVFVRFVPRFPTVNFTEWVSGTSYDAGAVVYMNASKDVYIAQQAVSGTAATYAPNTSAAEVYWQPVRISDDFDAFLTRFVAADLMTESQGKFQTKASAMSTFDEICERFHEGNGENRIRTGRFI